jgi:hypothetical protein
MQRNCKLWFVIWLSPFKQTKHFSLLHSLRLLTRSWWPVFSCSWHLTFRQPNVIILTIWAVRYTDNMPAASSTLTPLIKRFSIHFASYSLPLFALWSCTSLLYLNDCFMFMFAYYSSSYVCFLVLYVLPSILCAVFLYCSVYLSAYVYSCCLYFYLCTVYGPLAPADNPIAVNKYNTQSVHLHRLTTQSQLINITPSLFTCTGWQHNRS